MKRRITMAGIGLALVLVAVPAVAIAQGSNPAPTTPAECPYHAEHAGMPDHMSAAPEMHGTGMGSMQGPGMGSMHGTGMADHAVIHGSMMGTGD